MEQRQELLSLMLSRALLRAHHFQFCTDFARIVFPLLKGNE
jgi:hypothetical protein